MAGTVKLPRGRHWLPAGWVYDNVLERVAAILRSHNDSLAARLLESRIEVNGGHLDLEKSDAETLRLLLNAADEAYRQCEADGRSSFCQPEFFPGFMQRFAEFRQILRVIVLGE
jgi:hypothetical protein